MLRAETVIEQKFKNSKNSKTATRRIRTKDFSFDTPTPQPHELKALCCYTSHFSLFNKGFDWILFLLYFLLQKYVSCICFVSSLLPTDSLSSFQQYNSKWVQSNESYQTMSRLITYRHNLFYQLIEKWFRFTKFCKVRYVAKIKPNLGEV